MENKTLAWIGGIIITGLIGMGLVSAKTSKIDIYRDRIHGGGGEKALIEEDRRGS